MIGLMGHDDEHQGQQLQLRSLGRTKEGAAAAAAAAAPKKGCMAIRVGQQGEEQQRFVVPVLYLTHPLFQGLLKDAEEVYGFDYKGAISIPCHVDYFMHVQGLIQEAHAHAHAHAHARRKDHHHHFHLTSCFGGLKA